MPEKNKLPAMSKTMGRSGLNETRLGMKFSVLVKVVIIVRNIKFKMESKKFKKSLTFDFDKKVALNKLQSLFTAAGSLCKKEYFVDLSNYVRKFNWKFGDIGFTGVQLDKLCNLLKDDSLDDQTMYFLCLSLKHLCRNSEKEKNPVDVCSIAQRIATIGERPLVKDELVALLLCRLEKLPSGWMDSDESLKLRSTIENDKELNSDVKAQILGKLAGSEAPVRFHKQEKEHMNKSAAVRKVKKNQQFVTKTTQTVKSQQESKSSEEVDFESLNLSDCMKNRNKGMIRNTVIEPIDTLDTESGSDKSWTNSTWDEAINFYSIGLRDRVLKAEDKDEYLPDKFLGKHYYGIRWKNLDDDDKMMYSFFINRTFASIFGTISQKQQLNNAAIDVLMKCVVDLESMVSLLRLKKDYVKKLVDKMLLKYWDLKKLETDIMYEFFKKISKLTMEEYTPWYGITTQVRMKKHDSEELKRIVWAEINALRLDAIKAIYNCARRDLKEVLTEKRMTTFTNFAQKNDQSDKETKSYILKIMKLAEPLNDKNYVKNFETYVGYLEPDSEHDFIDDSIEFLTNKARDRERCQQFFTGDVIIKLIEIVGPTSCHNDKRKLDVLEIINIFLEHQETKALIEGKLRQLMDNCSESIDVCYSTISLMNAGLTSLLMSTEKSRYLSPQILNKLSTSFRDMSHNEKITSLIVFILSRVFCLDDRASQRFHIRDQIFLELVSRKLSCDHIVQLNGGDDEPRISFNKPSEGNAGYNPSNGISSLAAKIIAKSVEHRISLSSITINNLLSILQNNGQSDKQTMIIAAKCLYESTKYMSLGSDYLNELSESINCPIYDVSVYIQAAYLSECVKVASTTECLNEIHLEKISALYVEESLELNDRDYEVEINSNLFKTFLCEARKQKFNDENIFLLFNNILNLNGKYASNVLKILVAYSQTFLMPQTTVRTLENLLSVVSYFEEALFALQLFVLNGGLSITIKTLTVFSDYLCSSPSKRVRFNSFKLLDRLSQSQELPDSIFFTLELVKSSYALDYGIPGWHSVIQFVESITEKGTSLPVDTKKALESKLAHPDVLKTFQNVSKQGQIIDDSLLKSFFESFDLFSEEANTIANNKILIKIFENATKNNQPLPENLLEKLIIALRFPNLEPEVLPLFIYLAQKGQHLPQDVNHKLIYRLTIEDDPVMKQELLSCLGSLIVAQEKEIKFYLPKINRILEKEITSDNFNIQRSCVSTIAKMMTVSEHLDDKLLESLAKIGTDLNSNTTIKSEIRTLFDSIEDSCNPLIKERGYREQIKLANIVGTSHRDVFNQIVRYRDTEFLVQNYNQLKEIIDSGDESLQEQTLNMLINYKFNSKITDTLLDSIVRLCSSTMISTLSDLCINLLKQVTESGKLLAGRAEQILNDKLNRKENIQKFLQSSVCQEIKQEFKLDNLTIWNLIELIPESSKIDNVRNVTDLIKLIASEASNDYFNSRSFICFVEECLVKKKSVDVVLPYYCRIIKEQKYDNVQQCLEVLVECFVENQQEMAHHETRLFECLHNAHKFIHLSESCMEFAMENLGNSNPLIRGYSFGILKTSKEKHQNEKYTDALNCWSNLMIQRQTKNINVEIEQTEGYLDLLEIIMFVNILDVPIFTKEPRDLWNQELLISSIFSCFKVYPSDQINFNTLWSKVVDEFMYPESCKILLLIHNCTFDSFTQILELVTMIPELTTVDEVTRMLTIYGPEPYEAFEQDWCMKKVVQKLQGLNKQEINVNYSSKLAEKLCSLFNVSSIRKLMGSLKSIENLGVFEDLIDFCSKEKIDLNDMLNIENVSLNDVRNLIEANYLCKCSKIIQPECEADRQSYIKVYGTLKAASWKYEQLCQLAMAFNPRGTFLEQKERFQNWLRFLKTIQTYDLSPSNILKVHEILTVTTCSLEILQNLNKLVVENHFQLEGKVKDLPELKAELKARNEIDIDVDSLDINKLIFQEQKDKLEWSEKEINSWSKTILDRLNDQKSFTDINRFEAIAIILRANFLVTGQTLTDTQILSSLLALTPGKNSKGKLLQIATGEGKSTIICILAIIDALQGKRVDVITSSPVLAERDVKQKAKLYRMFNLTCSDNSDKTVYISGGKDCYKANVVYGEMSQFQFDILRDNYSKLGTLCERKLEVAIVDEVDSMLIDDSSKIARLSTTVPGMDHFQALYIIIWQRLLAIQEKLITFKKTTYFFYGNTYHENGKICLEMTSQKDEVYKITDLENFVLNNEDSISHVGEVVGDDMDGYLIATLGSFLDSQIEQNKIFIPSNFQDFLQKQKPKWIASAVEAAQNYQENVHYIVHGGEIKPVDYSSTGVVQSSTSWSDGLHQFLQLKHNLKMTSESLTTNFLSNIGYINKYQKICGVTGTLGSKTARSVFKDVYKVDLINIPQRREKQFLELEPIVAQGDADWLKEITDNIMLEIDKNRGILVICETIECANRINERLKTSKRNARLANAVKLYTTNDSKLEENVEKISAGQVIIATNLAGRGTDIQTDEIEPTGGLHVILTFLPNNERVEGQAFGRTARQGKRGTGLMILNGSSLIGYSDTTKVGLNKKREEAESSQLIDFQKNEFKLIQVKDSLFDNFCKFLNDGIRLDIRKKHNSRTKKILDYFLDLKPTMIEVCTLAAVEEQWASFLSKLDERVIPCEKAVTECEALIDQLRKDYLEDKLIKNPYYYVSIANDILVNEWSVIDLNNSKASRALDYFNKAIKLETEAKEQKMQKSNGDNKKKVVKEDDESVFSHGSAHLGVAWCSIILKKDDYKTNALASFQTASNCLSNEMSVLNATQLLLEQSGNKAEFVYSDLYKQLNVKATIFGSYLNGISNCIEAIKRSKRTIDLVAVKKGGNEKWETIEQFNEQERNENGSFKNPEMEQKLSSEMTYSLIFNHLTAQEDSGKLDQALKTLANSFNSCLHAASYSGIRLNLKSIELSKLNGDLFNPDKVFEELSRDLAIQTLKSERTYCDAFGITKSYKTNLTIRFYNEQKSNETLENKEMNELIKIIQEKEPSNENLRFDIVIKQANENYINGLFKKSEKHPSVQLNVDFDRLSQKMAIARLSKITAESYDVEFVLDKSKLIELIKGNDELQGGMLFVENVRAFQRVNRTELLDRVNKLETNESPCWVKFEKLKNNQTKKIIESCHENVQFGVSFLNVSNFLGSTAELGDGQVNFSFDQLKRETAEKLIDVLREKRIEFTLEFKNLSDSHVRQILKNADLVQEEMQIRKVKNIRELYCKGTIVPELNDFISKGIEYIIEISEKLFVPWRSICAVAALGVGQIILGGVLIGTGFGSTIGLGLATESMADFLMAYRAYSNRQFHWSDYCTQKAISVALSMISMGYSKLKEGAQGAVISLQNVATEMTQEALEQTGTRIFYNNNIVGEVLKKTSSNLKSLTLKSFGTKATETLTRECLNAGIQCLSNISFDRMKPRICESIQSQVRMSFNNEELKRYLQKMLAIDQAIVSATAGSGQRSQLQSRIEKIVSDTINPQNDFVRQRWNSIALRLINGILSDSSMYGSSASMAFRIASLIRGLNDVRTMTDNVSDALLTRLRAFDKDSMTIHLILHKHLNIDKNTTQDIVIMLKKQNILDNQKNFGLLYKDEIEYLRAKVDKFSAKWSRLKNQSRKREVILREEFNNQISTALIEGDDVAKCLRFITSFLDKYSQIKSENDPFSIIIKSVSDQITDQLIQIIDTQMLQPFTTLATSSVVDSVSQLVQNRLVDRNQNSDSQNADQEKYEKLSQKSPEDLTNEDKAFMRSYDRPRTFEEQIHYNSRDYCVAYLQSAMVYHANQENTKSTPVDKNVKERADQVRKGAPATIGEMMETAKAIGINLKVVDDPSYVKTREDIDNNVDVIYVKPDPKGGIGHASPMDRNGKFVEAKNDATKPDCFYVAISEHAKSKGINKTVDELRSATANRMESNPDYGKVIAAENRIRQTNPDEANSMTFAAGDWRDDVKIFKRLRIGPFEIETHEPKTPKKITRIKPNGEKVIEEY